MSTLEQVRIEVPLIDVNAQNDAILEELEHAASAVIRSGRYILGTEVAALEKEIAELVGVKHAIGVSSGTDALLVALMAIGIGPGDEVICPDFTFFATAGCVARLGATPVFADVCPVCFNLDAEKAAAKISSRTKAIIPVHLFGQSADMASIQSLAEEHDLKVIEDAAQALGAEYRGKPCGTIGDIGTYSFFPTKNLGGLGDGGMLVTDDDDLAHEARLLRNHGMEPKYQYQRLGGNFRLDEIQAALLRVKLRHLRDYETRRAANASYYHEALSMLPGVSIASEADCCCPLITEKAGDAAEGVGLVLPVAYAHNKHVWNQFTLRVTGGGRDRLKTFLAERRIASEIYYPVPLRRQPCFEEPGAITAGEAENADVLANEVLSLPVYPELADDQREAVVEAIRSFLL
ncbi:MAG: DegT/DnrJ/EryC1/StrS family aminotransferase [Verrucomicrobiota bacterium]